MSASTPPRRAPFYFDAEQYGVPLDQCARNLLRTLTGFADGVDVQGDLTGRLTLLRDDENSAEVHIQMRQGEARVLLSTHPSHWVRAEVFVDDEIIARAWIDEPYEEKDLWPDCADGIVPPGGDPPGRISKRGAWLQIARARFPGLPETGNAFWAIERAD